MRIFFKSAVFTVSITLVAFSIQSPRAIADGGEDYYNDLRKLKKFDPVEVAKLKKKDVIDERIKEVSELAKVNTEANKIADKKLGPIADSKPSQAEKASHARSSSRPSTSSSSSDSVKVNSDTPDELNFPGDDKEKK